MPVTNRKIIVGVCAMEKKAKSKAMSAILTRLEKFGEFEILVFGDERILREPVEEWPKVDALLSWFSDGFPLAKAEAYAKLHKPFVVNNLNRQWDLLDRRLVYKTLQDNGIPVPPHVVVNRNEPSPRGIMPDHAALFEAEGFEEYEDYVALGDQKIAKPFVEKPADAENHNICIYYPHTVGGGYKALFRKIGNQASKYYPPPPADGREKPYSVVRRDTSFIYENFMSTGGTDVKVYTVGPNYAHAEARKSPVVDGRVQRDANGKEERFPVLLTPEEKEIARRVCLAFGQMVCGFDLLRTKGRSYVCDVNGWSFVKNSTKYFDDASLCLRAMILRAVAPDHRITAEAQTAAEETTDEANPNSEGGEHHEGSGGEPHEGSAAKKTARLTRAKKEDKPPEELRAVLAVIRHGDRTPKQKMKMKVRHAPLLDLLARCTAGRPRKQAKLKTPQRLQELLNICRVLYSDSLREGERFHPDVGERSPRRRGSDESSGEGTGGVDSGSGSGGVAAEFPIGASTPEGGQSREEWEEELEQWKQVVSILQEGGHFSGINRKAQLKPLAWEPVPEREREPRGADGKDPPAERVTEALLILKFGGVLTHLGKNQAEFLGRDFRMRMYPGGNYYDRGAGTDGLLRLHSTYRHDLKIYSSDEGRVQITAAAFAKGLLDLETENHQLTPILASLVNKDAKLLDFVTHEVEEDILHAKQKLYNIMTEGHVRGGGKMNKEYSTSDTAVIDDDIERAGPVGYLRRSSNSPMAMPARRQPAQTTTSPGKEGASSSRRASADADADARPGPGASAPDGASGDPTPAASAGVERADAILGTGGVSGGSPADVHDASRSYTMMAADRSRALKTARRSITSAEEKGRSPEKPSMRKRSSENDLQKRTEDEEDEEEDHPPGGARDPPSRTSALTREMRGLEVSAADDRESGGADASSDPGSPGGFRRRGSVGAAAAQGGGAGSQADHQPRSSWNAGDAKALLKSRLAMGLPEDFATGAVDSPTKAGTYEGSAGSAAGSAPRLARRTSLDVGDPFDADEIRASVEGSITRRPPGVPAESLKLLRLMVELIGSLTHQLRREIFQHGKVHHVAGAEHAGGRVMSGGNATAGNATAAGAAPVGSPTTWVDALGALAPRGSIPEGGLGALRVASVPAGGESFLLMHARWKKLHQDIYHPRKGRFDISKVPDVYDAAKYDAIHNSHLSLDGLEELYRVSRRLAEGVVPNEYGTHPQSKLRIGGTIAHSLLLKLLQDMFTTREETFVGMPQSHVAPQQGGSALSRESRDGCFSSDGGGRATGGSESDTSQAGGGGDRGGARRGAQKAHHAAAASDPLGAGEDARDPRGLPEVDEEDAAALKEEEEEELSTTRLNHRIANTVGVHSPHRHVRTRLYFTSESHIHSLLNVLRYCNLEVAQFGRIGEGSGTPAGPPGGGGVPGFPPGASAASPRSGASSPGAGPDLANAPPSLLSRSMETLENIGDLDYLTHIVFRMYERFDFAPTDPRRFRVEILLSTGVGLDPFKRNVIQEFEKAAADAHRREKASVSPGAVTGQRRKSEDAASLPLVRQFPVQNDRAKAPRRAADEEAAAAAAAAAAAGKEKGKDNAAAKREKNAAYLTLDDLETYLWKFRRNKSGGLGVGAGGGHGSSASDGAWSPKKEALPGRTSFSKEERKKSYLGGPKRSKERKKKGSDSESE